MNNLLKAFLVIAALLPGIALAGPFDPPPGDISLMVLNQVFGGLLQGGQDAFGNSITTFNSAVLALGGILAAYTILAGTLGTAHDGEMLGKKFSSVWIPIRYALGTALVLPVLPGGYCIMQQIVMWLVVQGVGLADMVWTSYVGAPVGALTAKMSLSNKKSILTFAEQVALAQGCTAGAASVLNAGGSGGVVSSILRTVNTYDYRTIVNPKNPNEYWMGDQAPGLLSFASKTTCGSATIPGQVETDLAGLYGTTAGSVGASPATGASGPSATGKLGVISTAFTAPDTTAIYNAHLTAANSVISSLGSAAQSAAASKQPLPYSAVISAADNYIKSVESAATAYIGGAGDPFAQLRTQSATQGWFLAGAWYTRLTMMNQQIQSSVNIAPSANGTTALGSNIANWLDSVNPAVRLVQSEILLRRKEMDSAPSGEKDDTKGKTSTQSNGSAAASFTNYIAAGLTGIDMANLQNDTRPPVMILQEAGSRLINIWEASMGTMLAATALTGLKILGNGWDSGPMVMTIIGFLAAPIGALVGLGFTLGYMLPNLPFLMWIGVILGWLIMVIEAILAAPLWAVMHLHPNGDDLTGKGANGYMLVLGLTLRPVLTIFGLIAALVVTDIMGEFINKVFFSIFQTGNPWGFKAILVTVFAFSIYTMAQFSLFKKTFALMHVIPDQLLRWIGGGGEQLGQYAGSIADGSGKAAGAIATLGAFAGEKAIDHTRNGIMQGRQAKDNAMQRDQQKLHMNNELDQKFGEGTAQQAQAHGADAGGVKGFTDLKNSKKTQAAFSTGLSKVQRTGGDDGVASYKEQMEAAKQDGYSQYGGKPDVAAEQIASKVEQESIHQQAQLLGPDAESYLKKVAGRTDSNGQFSSYSGTRAASALGLIGQARNTVPEGQLNTILGDAAQKPNAVEAKGHVEKEFAKINSARNLQKSQAGQTAFQAADTDMAQQQGNSGINEQTPQQRADHTIHDPTPNYKEPRPNGTTEAD